MAWAVGESDELEDIYAVEKDLSVIAARLGIPRLNIQRKLTSLGIYEKKVRPVPSMNRDMLAREICKILDIKLLTMGNMSRGELRLLLEHLEKNND